MSPLNRRTFLSAFSAAAAGLAFDPERLLWVTWNSSSGVGRFFGPDKTAYRREYLQQPNEGENFRKGTDRFLYIQLPLALLALGLQFIGVSRWNSDGYVKWCARATWLCGALILGGVFYDIAWR